MPTERERLDRLEEANASIKILCESLTTGFKDMDEKMDDVIAEIGGARPWRSRGDMPTMRDRLHKLESNTSPVMFKFMMDEYMKARSATLWTAPQKFAVIVAALAGAVVSILRIAGVGG